MKKFKIRRVGKAVTRTIKGDEIKIEGSYLAIYRDTKMVFAIRDWEEVEEINKREQIKNG